MGPATASYPAVSIHLHLTEGHALAVGVRKWTRKPNGHEAGKGNARDIMGLKGPKFDLLNDGLFTEFHPRTCFMIIQMCFSKKLPWPLDGQRYIFLSQMHPKSHFAQLVVFIYLSSYLWFVPHLTCVEKILGFIFFLLSLSTISCSPVVSHPHLVESNRIVPIFSTF